MALTKIKADGLTADLIDETKLADNSIDSEHYNDGSIDNAHLADDAVGVAELSATGTASSSTFLRGDNSWAAVTSTTINNNADNRVITGSGTANTLEGEANLTYNGTRLNVGTGDLAVTGAEGGDAQLRLTADEGDDGADYWRLESKASDNNFNLATYASGAWVDKVTVDSSGNVNIGIASQFDSNKVNMLGTKAYSSGIPQQQLNVADAQAYSTTDNGGSIGFSAKFNSGGAYTTMASIEGVKHNNIDGNYQGALAFKTRNNNGDNVIRMRLTDNGLCFGTDTAGANALNDYEEGTWTPALSNSGGITLHNAWYTKIGRLCNISAYVTISSNSSSGSLLFTGLPFVSADIGYAIGAAYTQNTAGTHVFTQVNKNNSTVNVYRTNGATILQSDMSGAYCLFSATYRTT